MSHSERCFFAVVGVERMAITSVIVAVVERFCKPNGCAADPACEVVRPTTEEPSATLMCRMTYEWQARSLQFTQPPGLNVSLSWTGVSGITVSTSADPATFSGTLETNMAIDNLTPSNISSYNCTITFKFSPGFDHFYQYAVNPLSYTCQPSPLSCKSES